MTLGGQGALHGQRLGQYQLDALLGAGGMAEVYRAHSVARHSLAPVAVKILPANLAADPGYVRRFREEADRVAALKHPNIVRVLASGEQRGLLYLVMPLLKESLRDRLHRERRLPFQDAISIAGQIAAALVVAHGAGLIHRDVKPENIMLDGRGRALLTDFGIARPIAPRRGGTLYTVSSSGLPVGTPEYMPPEQLRAEHIDQRADTYALGAVLYEMLTGSVPFPADTPYEVAALVFTAPLAHPSQLNREITPQLDAVVMKALARDPNARYQDALSFEQELRTATSPPRPTGLLARAGLRTAGALTQLRSRQPAPLGAAPVGAVGYGAGYGPPMGSVAPGAANRVPTLPPVMSVTSMPTERPGSWPTATPTLVPEVARRAARTRWLWTGAIVALLAVTVCGGGSLAAASKLGLVFARSEPTVVPTVTPTETPEPTETPIPTETPKPVPMLVSGQFSWSSSNVGTWRSPQCKWTGQQEIKNPTDGQALGWHWQAITPAPSSTLKWWLNDNSSQQSSGLPYQQSLAAGSATKLNITFTVNGSCGSNPKFTVQAYDTLNRPYTFST